MDNRVFRILVAVAVASLVAKLIVRRLRRLLRFLPLVLVAIVAAGYLVVGWHHHPPHEDEHASPAEKLQAKQDRVVLTGTTGATHCTVTDDDGNRFSVTPAVPGEIEANVGGMSGVLSATCVKAYAQGSLTMKLVVDGEVVKKKTTTAPRGIVSAAY